MIFEFRAYILFQGFSPIFDYSDGFGRGRIPLAYFVPECQGRFFVFAVTGSIYLALDDFSRLYQIIHFFQLSDIDLEEFIKIIFSGGGHYIFEIVRQRGVVAVNSAFGVYTSKLS